MNTINVYQTADEKKHLTWKIEREIIILSGCFSIPIGRVLIEMHLVFILVYFFFDYYCAWLLLAGFGISIGTVKHVLFVTFKRTKFCNWWLCRVIKGRRGEGHENWFQSQEMDFSSYSLIFFFSFWNLPMNVKIL